MGGGLGRALENIMTRSEPPMMKWVGVKARLHAGQESHPLLGTQQL